MKYAKLVPQLIEGWATTRPDAPALVGPHGVTTYAELWEQATAWAGAIGELAGPDPVVGVMRSRDALIPVVQLAAWMAGAAYLPLDPSLPRGRLETILREAGCRAVFTTDELRHLLPDHIVTITRPAAAIAPMPWDPERLAYVIYTSGSTGTPKGVEIEHRNLAALMHWYRDFYTLGQDSRTSMFSNVAFDCLVVDVWAALHAGGAVAVPEQSVLSDPHEMARFLDEFGVQHSNMPTAMFERLLAAGVQSTTVRTIETGSEQLRSWPAPDYPAAVYNAYGPTEATVQVTITGDLRTYRQRNSLPPLGRPLPGVEIALVDSSGTTITEPGRSGELVISGDLVGRGYRNRPELTLVVFTAGPPRAYRTGDLCRWNADGELEYLGRIDDQVQLTGYRVEPGEIEQQMMRVPGVRLAVVAPVGEGTSVSLHAWVEGEIEPEKLTAALRENLPEYMVPVTLKVLDQLPMTVNGKIDRRELVAALGTV
ncbi:amino acid adenylation domain-containing protein [Dactylosporangium sp. NPDC051484]|uniref:amino acid adenylation domain-containing protein n=1 Tax=Dactylosporangium sp. NPDC051484 TaxID=3154942 RepID=UPI0034509F1C